MYDGGYLIGKINKLTARKLNELLKESGMSEFNGAQGTILHILWKTNEMTIKEISEKTGLAKTSLTSMLERMEKQGLVERVPNENDKRSTLVRLTDKSKALEKEYDKITEEMIYQYYRDFSEEEIITFEKMLERIVRNLEGEK